MDTAPKIRPYWHIDAKWVCGILAFIFLAVSLVLFALLTLTSEKVALPLETLIVASQFSRDGLDDPKDIDETKKKYLSTKANVFYPLNGNLEVKITREELQTLSPRELRLRIFQQVVEPYYKEGVDGVAERQGRTQEEKDKIKRDGSLLGLVTAKTHQNISNYFMVSLIPTVLTLLGLTYFSNRYGRIVSPAIIFILVSSFPSALLLLISLAKSKPGDGGPIPFLPTEVAQELATTLATPYYLLFLGGLGLIVLATLVKLISRFRKKQS